MSLIVAVSGRIAKAIHNANREETSSTERLTALLAIQMNNYGVIITALSIGAVTGAFWGTALSLAVFVLLRIYTGGFHLKNLDACFIVSTVLLSAIPHIHVSALLPTFVAVLIFATKRKFIPSLLIAANIFVGSPIIALAALAQALTILKGGEQLEKTTCKKSL
jgi:accessory gene regulator B